MLLFLFCALCLLLALYIYILQNKNKKQKMNNRLIINSPYVCVFWKGECFLNKQKLIKKFKKKKKNFFLNLIGQLVHLLNSLPNLVPAAAAAAAFQKKRPSSSVDHIWWRLNAKTNEHTHTHLSLKKKKKTRDFFFRKHKFLIN